jgi:hypothetical protein
MLVKRDGRFSGEAYVVMGTNRLLETVLKKDKSYIGRRYIEVFVAKKMVRCRPAFLPTHAMCLSSTDAAGASAGLLQSHTDSHDRGHGDAAGVKQSVWRRINC